MDRLVYSQPNFNLGWNPNATHDTSQWHNITGNMHIISHKNLSHFMSRTLLSKAKMIDIHTKIPQLSQFIISIVKFTYIFTSTDHLTMAAKPNAVPRLSKGDYEKLQQQFKFIDTDANGQLSKEEMETAVKRLGMDPKFPDLIFAICDKDHSGSVQFAEFRCFMQALNAIDPNKFESQEKFFKLVFDSIDKDKNNTLNSKELLQFFELIGASVKPEEVDKWISEIDIKGTKSVTFLEVFRWLKLGAKRAEERRK
jgi:Ca2+-binding EF-hand superfamily protein